MDIPIDQLKPELLRSIAEEFVTREGTDYGDMEVSLDEKVAQVMDQIKRGLAVIRFDTKTQTCGVFPVD
jgi:uncharacterized protein